MAAEIGFEPIFLGRLEVSRPSEPLAMAWIVLRDIAALAGTSRWTW